MWCFCCSHFCTARIRASRILREPEAQAAILEEQKWLQQKHHITTDTAVQMLLESHRKAATATEEVAAIREIAKMLGLYQPEKKQMDSVDIHKIEQLAQMSDEELLKLADLPVVDLF